MKIAKFRRIDDEIIGWDVICKEQPADNYIRITEYVDVDFVPLPNEQIVPDQVKVLKEEKEKESARHVTAMARLDERISKLLAITQQ